MKGKSSPKGGKRITEKFKTAEEMEGFLNEPNQEKVKFVDWTENEVELK